MVQMDAKQPGLGTILFQVVRHIIYTTDCCKEAPCPVLVFDNHGHAAVTDVSANRSFCSDVLSKENTKATEHEFFPVGEGVASSNGVHFQNRITEVYDGISKRMHDTAIRKNEITSEFGF
eukprot:5618413-Amphidinium_carterae.1